MQRGWLGIDIGTQSVKAHIVGDSGASLGFGSFPLTSHRGEGGHTQSPAEWIRAAEHAVSAAVAESHARAEAVVVSGVAVSATSGTIVLLDRDGHPTSHGIMYDDTRGALNGERVRRIGEELWERLGYPMADSWALPKVCGLSTDQFSNGETLGQQADVITSWLAGRRVKSDASHALKSGYDIVGRSWPTELLERLDLDPSIFPEVVCAGEVLGRVDDAVAIRLGLPAGVPIVAGMTDGCSSQIGSGDIHIGSWTSTIGSTLVLKGVSESLIGDRAGGVYSHAAPFGAWLVGGASNVGATAISELLPEERLESLELALPSLSTVPLMYPLTGKGERFPFASDRATGFVVNGGREVPLESWTGDSPTLFAGIMLGIALVERLCFETMGELGAPIGGVVSLSGGATANRWWNQLRSDVLGMPVRVSSAGGAARGAAVIAAGAVQNRLSELPAVAESMSSPGESYEPAKDNSGLLRERYEEFTTRLRSRGYLTAREPITTAESSR